MTEKETKELSRLLKSQMVLADITCDKLGGATGRAWRYRLANPNRMTVEDMAYLLERIGLKMTIK